MFILIGNLFLRGLLVKHAKYISLESHLNTLMVSDFGLPVWILIVTFSLLITLGLGLNSDFPYNFPNVRTCRHVTTFIGPVHHAKNYKMLLYAVVGLSLLTGFILLSHSKMSDFRRVFKMIGRRKQLRQNVTTAKQILASAYLKVFCSVLSVRSKIFSLELVFSCEDSSTSPL